MMKRNNDHSHAAVYKKRKLSQKEEFHAQNGKILDRGDYTVGWICALPVELAAARVMRDEEHSQINVAEGDTNSYVLGRIAAHGVVMACLPQGTVGTNSAAIVATNMTRTFPKLRFILLVGVGAGSPDTDSPDDESNIRLGDVVVSRPDDKNGGVIQYDFGHSLQSGVFDGGKSLNKPPSILRTAVARLEAFHVTEDSSIDDILQETYRRYPRIEKKFQHPGEAQDLLFRADYEHITGQTNCTLCQSRYLVSRQHRDSSTPVVHYGLIASANQVMKDALKRERMRKDLGVICFEMEAAGMMDDCPCLVVRGICDYADSHKNKQWQPYAALTAAAYAKELLRSMEASSIRNESVVELVDILQDQLKVTQDQVELARNHHQREDMRRQEDKHQACHRVFDISNYERQKNMNPDAVPGTCRWVLDHPEYAKWQRSTEGNLFWISADPGCGKSVLSKSLVDSWLRATRPAILETTETATSAEAKSRPTKPDTICYFFFKDNEEQSSLATALCAILHQLFSQQPEMIRHALPSFERNAGASLTKKINELWRILLAVMNDENVRPVTCVLDALDECCDNDRKQFIQLLCTSYEHHSYSRVKWLVTGRPHYDIQGYLSSLPLDMRLIRLRGEDENDQIRKEIDLVIEARMMELCSKHNLSEAKEAEITRSLRGMENRTYLWLHLVIDDIETTLKTELIMDEARISSLPPTVEVAYEKILQRITNRTEQHRAKSILTIIVGAPRPLSLEEMALALGISTFSRLPKCLADLSIDPSNLGDKIRQLCGLFIFINHGQLYLIHQTAKEFLVRSGSALVSDSWRHCLHPLDVEKEMARICILFLSLSDFESDHQESRHLEREHNDEKNGVESFFAFTSEHWADYTRAIEMDLDEQIRSHVRALYDTRNGRFTRWTSIWRKTRHIPFDVARLKPIHLASFLGHQFVLQWILKLSPHQIDLKDGTGRTAVIHGAEKGYEQVVQLLLDAGANPNTGNGYALFTASSRGYQKVVKMLLDAGANPNVGREEISALFVASGLGHEDIVRILLDTGANPNTRFNDMSALFIASEHGHEEIVQMLLDAGVNPNTRFNDMSALYAALVRGHEKTVRILVAAGANPSTEFNGASAFYAASRDGREKIVQTLLGARANPNSKLDERSILYTASLNGHGKIVQILLDAGADVNAQGGRYGTPLGSASAAGHEQIVRMLINAGADVNTQGGRYGTPLSTASRHGHDKIVQLLLHHGATQKSSLSHCSTKPRGFYHVCITEIGNERHHPEPYRDGTTD